MVKQRTKKRLVPQVNVLLTGVFRWVGKDHCLARCTTTLVRVGNMNIVVDPGNAVQAPALRRMLTRYGLTPRAIHLVVNTHYHPDHVGANFLFPQAAVVDGESVCRGDEFIMYDTARPLVLAPGVEVIATPGHTAVCCSVLVQIAHTRVAIVGDLFWLNQAAKLGWAEYPKKLKASQRKILRLADYVVPGHGKKFKVKK